MTKEHILSEIRRTTSENGGAPLGVRTFAAQTGIRQGHWYGKHWAKWGDAVREAGFQPNRPTPRIGDDQLLERYALLARELGRAPVAGDLLLAKRRDATFPAAGTFLHRFGSYAKLRARAHDHCAKQAVLTDVLPLVVPQTQRTDADSGKRLSRPTIGFVYLIQSGEYYKIGLTDIVEQRERGSGIQPPEKARRVHSIRTDDPAGIEAYWHHRFAWKRVEGGWFKLDRDDVTAFKRRRVQ